MTAALLLALAAGCSADGDADVASAEAGASVDPTVTSAHHPAPDASEETNGLVAANLATAGFQDVEVAEAAGYASTIDALGCFEDSELGGMGVHYLDESLMDDVVDVAKPEALVYELGANGDVVALVAHEYIVPVEAWTKADPPELFGVDFHQHPVLPLWVLHAWIWKDNPVGVFADWNPKVRPCPTGVPVFGVDLPEPTSIRRVPSTAQ